MSIRVETNGKADPEEYHGNRIVQRRGLFERHGCKALEENPLEF